MDGTKPKHEKLILVFAFLLPLLLIGAVVFASLASSWRVHTEYDFLYATCTSSGSYVRHCDESANQRLEVIEGTLTLTEVELEENEDDSIGLKTNYSIRVFYYDSSEGSSREITLDEAQSYTLSPLVTSPDGVSFSNEYDRSPDVFPFFGGRGTYGHYLVSESGKKKIDLINSNDTSYYYGNGLKFAGWIVESN